jgi:predicted metallopeptidase
MTTHINAAAAYLLDAAAVPMEEFKSNELKFKKHSCAEKCRVIITRLILIIVNRSSSKQYHPEIIN